MFYVQENDFEMRLILLSEVAIALNEFLDVCRIDVEDVELRQSRLKLLALFQDLSDDVISFGKIHGDPFNVSIPKTQIQPMEGSI